MPITTKMLWETGKNFKRGFLFPRILDLNAHMKHARTQNYTEVITATLLHTHHLPRTHVHYLVKLRQQPSFLGRRNWGLPVVILSEEEADRGFDSDADCKTDKLLILTESLPAALTSRQSQQAGRKSQEGSWRSEKEQDTGTVQ